jgi:hypothetical protein
MEGSTFQGSASAPQQSVDSSHNPPDISKPSSTKGATRSALSADDKVVICFSLIGFLGSVGLYFIGLPAIMIAVFLATGVASLVYRFLGGIQGASLQVGAIKITGTLAALIGISIPLNNYLADQLSFRLLSDDDVVGEWHWVWGGGGWDGTLTFTKVDGQLQFSGEQFKVAGETHPKLLYILTNGRARLNDRRELDLECEVEDREYNRHFSWHSTAAFPLTPAFRGELRPNKEPSHPDFDHNVWGMMIYKWPVTRPTRAFRERDTFHSSGPPAWLVVSGAGNE